MKLSIIIVNYNVKHFLEQCLKSVEKALISLDSEVIVVDNNSVDGSVKMIKDKFPSVKLIANKQNTGFSVANNQAIAVAKGSYILLLNPDTVVQEDTFTKCISFMDEHQDAGALGIKMFDGKGNFLPESKRGLPTPSVAFFKIFGLSTIFPKSRLFGKYHLGYLSENQNHKVDILSGAFMMIRKKVIDEIGALDETFFMYGEDIDISYRITKAGYNNYYFSGSNIIHYKGESTKKSSINYVFVFYKAMIIFAKKHFSKKHIKTFSFLIKLAIYFRAFIAILNRLSKQWIISMLEFVISSYAIYELAIFYQNYNEIVFPKKTIQIMIPVYAFTWMMSHRFFQNQFPPLKINNVIKGTVVGLFILLASYALLPKSIQFSRAVILISSLLSFIIAWLIRLLFQKAKIGTFENYQKNKQRRLIVGSINEINRIENLLNYSDHSSSTFKINTKESQDYNEFDGNIAQLDEFIKINKIDEVIFCAKDLTSREIISCMANVNIKKDVEFKIVPDKSQFIIGSQSIYTNDIFQSTTINHINNIRNIRVKRNFDMIGSIIILVALPIFFYLKNYRTAFSNTIQVLKGKKTWIGYIQTSNNDNLPKIKQPVFDLFSSNSKLSDEISDKLNIIYAKDYNVQKDIILLCKRIFR